MNGHEPIEAADNAVLGGLAQHQGRAAPGNGIGMCVAVAVIAHAHDALDHVSCEHASERTATPCSVVRAARLKRAGQARTGSEPWSRHTLPLEPVLTSPAGARTHPHRQVHVARVVAWLCWLSRFNFALCGRQNG